VFEAGIAHSPRHYTRFPDRGFVLWRLSDDGPGASRILTMAVIRNPYMSETLSRFSARRLSIKELLSDAPSTGTNSLSAGAAASRPCDLFLKRPSTRGYIAEHPTDIKRLAVTSSSSRVERVQQVQRRCPWARAMIASPYIRQLRHGLPLCCIHGQSRGKDGAHLHNGRSARPNLRWVSAVTHPTRPTPTRRSVGTVSL
jgi:hypothetical protein